MKLKHEEERLQFEHSKHKKRVRDAVSQECMIQSIQDRHSSATERYQNMCAKKKAQIRQSRCKYYSHACMLHNPNTNRENQLLRSLECKLTSKLLEASFEKWRSEKDTSGKQSLERAHHVVQVAKYLGRSLHGLLF